MAKWFDEKRYCKFCGWIFHNDHKVLGLQIWPPAQEPFSICADHVSDLSSSVNIGQLLREMGNLVPGLQDVNGKDKL